MRALVLATLLLASSSLTSFAQVEGKPPVSSPQGGPAQPAPSDPNPSSRPIDELTGVNPEVMTVGWGWTGGCAGANQNAWAGTIGKGAKTCGAGTVTNIVIATGIALDTAIGTTETIEVENGWTETEVIEATMKISLGSA